MVTNIFSANYVTGRRSLQHFAGCLRELYRVGTPSRSSAQSPCSRKGSPRLALASTRLPRLQALRWAMDRCAPQKASSAAAFLEPNSRFRSAAGSAGALCALHKPVRFERAFRGHIQLCFKRRSSARPRWNANGRIVPICQSQRTTLQPSRPRLCRPASLLDTELFAARRSSPHCRQPWRDRWL